MTSPGSFGHEKPLFKKTHPVIPLIIMYHSVSIHREDLEIKATAASRSDRPSFCFASSDSDFRLAFLRRDCPSEKLSLHNIHGRMKYLGSTRGAVARERVDATNHNSNVEEGIPTAEPLLELDLSASIQACAKNR